MLRSVGWFCTDVSGLGIRTIFKCQDVFGSICPKKSLWVRMTKNTLWPLKMGPIRSPETSVQNQPTLLNIPEDGRIRVNHSIFVNCNYARAVPTYKPVTVASNCQPITPYRNVIHVVIVAVLMHILYYLLSSNDHYFPVFLREETDLLKTLHCIACHQPAPVGGYWRKQRASCQPHESVLTLWHVAADGFIS